ncbi:MAG: hypothetical protein R3C28_24850 [Pirellulaceae bacterium]
MDLTGAGRLVGIHAADWCDRSRHAFLGIDGPYWTDLDQDNAFSFVAPALDGDDQIIPNEFVTLTTDADDDGFVDTVTIGDRTYGDANMNGIVDVGESAELNENATGIALSDVDFGLAMMTPSLGSLPQLDKHLPKLYSLDATAAEIGIVGASELTLTGQQLDIDLNFGDRWFKKLNLPIDLGIPAVDFVSSFPAEDANDSGTLDDGEDTDGDGKLDPVGLEIATGGEPVYLDNANAVIRGIAGHAELGVADFVHLGGSLAFELSQPRAVTVDLGIAQSLLDEISAAITPEVQTLADQVGLDLSNGTVTTSMKMLTVGGRDLVGFMGMNGPYRSDTNLDGQIDATDDANSEAVGLALTNLDAGVAVMQPQLALLDAIAALHPSLKAAVEAAKPRFVAIDGSADELQLIGVEQVSLCRPHGAGRQSFHRPQNSRRLHTVCRFCDQLSVGRHQ